MKDVCRTCEGGTMNSNVRDFLDLSDMDKRTGLGKREKRERERERERDRGEGG